MALLLRSPRVRLDSGVGEAHELTVTWTAAGGKAVAAVCSTEEGERLVKAAIDAFGSLHSTSVTSREPSLC